MSDKLNDEAMALLGKRLEEERLRLRGEIRDELLRSGDEHYAELAGQVHDSGDESVADLVNEVNTTILSKLIRELREVEAAEERHGSGDYGLCEDCGEPIGLERLKAQPATRRCIRDQERFEHESGADHNPTL